MITHHFPLKINFSNLHRIKNSIKRIFQHQFRLIQKYEVFILDHEKLEMILNFLIRFNLLILIIFHFHNQNGAYYTHYINLSNVIHYLHNLEIFSN
jgi:hypothetical protein